MPVVSVNGIRIYYQLHGPEDAQVLVLSNGVLMSTASWGYQTPVLSRRHRLLLYDCRGQWQSDHPPGPYSMELHADDLAGLLQALDIQRAHIGGISYGAEISLVFALKYPKMTRSLIVSSAVSQVDPLLRGIIGMWIGAARRKDPDLFYQVTYPFNFSQRWIAANAQLLEQARERYATLDYEAVVHLCQAFLELDITADLRRINTPTLVMVGEEDLLKPRRYADIIARQIPHAEYVVIPSSGHAVCWEQPDVFNSLVLGFLGKQGGKDS